MLLYVLRICACLAMVAIAGCGRIEKSGDTINAEFEAQFPAPLGDSGREMLELVTKER